MLISVIGSISSVSMERPTCRISSNKDLKSISQHIFCNNKFHMVEPGITWGVILLDFESLHNIVKWIVSWSQLLTCWTLLPRTWLWALSLLHLRLTNLTLAEILGSNFAILLSRSFFFFSWTCTFSSNSSLIRAAFSECTKPCSISNISSSLNSRTRRAFYRPRDCV